MTWAFVDKDCGSTSPELQAFRAHAAAPPRPHSMAALFAQVVREDTPSGAATRRCQAPPKNLRLFLTVAVCHWRPQDRTPPKHLRNFLEAAVCHWHPQEVQLLPMLPPC